MDIIKVYAVLKHFNPSNDNWKSPLNCRVGQAFRLLPDHPKYGFCCIINFDIYETNLDTDFILDVPAEVVVMFTPKGKWTTEEELYECYLKAIEEVNKDLVKEALQRGINVDVTIKANTFDGLKPNISKAIQDSFDITYDKNDL